MSTAIFKSLEDIRHTCLVGTREAWRGSIVPGGRAQRGPTNRGALLVGVHPGSTPLGRGAGRGTRRRISSGEQVATTPTLLASILARPALLRQIVPV